MSARPGPRELWEQAGGGTPSYSRERYRELMIEHGHLVQLAPGERAEPLPCGWPHSTRDETKERTPMPKPPDRRPHRAQHESGNEIHGVVGNQRVTLRQVGWQGQSGAFYSLDEDPSPYERGSFSPLWVIAHSDDLLPEHDQAGAAA